MANLAGVCGPLAPYRVPGPTHPVRCGPGAGGGERACLVGRDLQVNGGAALGVQPDPHLVRAHGLDRIADLDPAPVEFGAAGFAHGRGDVGRTDRAEQPAAVARAPPHAHLQALEVSLDDLRVFDAADLPGRTGPLDQVDLLLGAAGPVHRETARDQVVAA